MTLPLTLTLTLTLTRSSPSPSPNSSKATLHEDLSQALDKLRWLQSKALADGSVPHGRYRGMLYWESLKSSRAREGSLSWRGDDDPSRMSRLVDMYHQMERGVRGEAPMAWA